MNHGLTMYISMDRKPENGCEIQNAAFGASGILMRLKLVRTVEEEVTHFDKNNAGLDPLHSGDQVSSFALGRVGLHRLHRFVLCVGCYSAGIEAARAVVYWCGGDSDETVPSTACV
jgi:hypothetical protein